MTSANASIRQIRKINQNEARKSQAPYDKPFIRANLPRIIDDTSGAVVVFDGWQNLPPQNLSSEDALNRAFNRCICIQKAQIRNRLTFVAEKLLKRTMIVQTVLSPYKVAEEEERKKRQGKTTFTNDGAFKEESESA